MSIDPRLAGKFDDIEQDALPGLDTPPTAQGGSRQMKSQPSVAFGICPDHVNDGRALTGLIAITRERLVFRDHTKRIGNVTVPCPGSGKPGTPSTPNPNQ